MGELATEAISPVRESPSEVFPLPLSSVVSLSKRILSRSVDDLTSFVAVRHQGRSADMLTVLYDTNLADWHIDRSDFLDGPDRLLYEVGELYGTQILTERVKTIGRISVTADDPDAYSVARQVVLHSYDGIEASDSDIREQARERKFTGSADLMLLSELVHDHGELRQVGDLRMFHTGLIDAAIFTKTYTRFKQGMPPKIFVVADAA